MRLGLFLIEQAIPEQEAELKTQIALL